MAGLIVPPMWGGLSARRIRHRPSSTWRPRPPETPQPQERRIHPIMPQSDQHHCLTQNASLHEEIRKFEICLFLLTAAHSGEVKGHDGWGRRGQVSDQFEPLWVRRRRVHWELITKATTLKGSISIFTFSSFTTRKQTCYTFSNILINLIFVWKSARFTLFFFKRKLLIKIVNHCRLISGKVI